MDSISKKDTLLVTEAAKDFSNSAKTEKDCSGVKLRRHLILLKPIIRVNYEKYRSNVGHKRNRVRTGNKHAHKIVQQQT